MVEVGPGSLVRPVVLVRHRKEKKSKCSLQPLWGRPGFLFLTYPVRSVPSLEGYVRLALEGPPLGEADREAGLLLLDATWRLVQPMERRFASVPPRTLPPSFQTAYPRASKLFDDPGGGLASIEALYLALRVLGRATDGLLDGYQGRGVFLSENAAALAALDARGHAPPGA